jgi:hypothetical protein
MSHLFKTCIYCGVTLYSTGMLAGGCCPDCGAKPSKTPNLTENERTFLRSGTGGMIPRILVPLHSEALYKVVTSLNQKGYRIVRSDFGSALTYEVTYPNKEARP